MSSLQYGLAPKMKPVSPKRSALVAALDIGTSKIVCLIARLTPHAPQETLRRRSHGIEIIGIGHVEAHGMKAGHVADIHAAEEAIRRAVDLAEQSAAVQLESVAVSISAGRLASEPSPPAWTSPGRRSPTAKSRACSHAGSRHSARDGRVVMHSLPIGYALDDARGVREPRGMLARQFGVDMHVVTADLATPRNLMLAVEQCHLAVEAMVACALMAGLSALADDESDLGVRRRRYGGGDHHHRGLLGRPLRPCRRLRGRGPARDPGPGARTRRPDHGCRANQDVLWHCAGRMETTNGT